MARFPGLAACLVAGFGVSAFASAFAQELLLDVPSPVRGALAYHGIAIGDWDGDGTGDLAIGAILDSTAGPQMGAARIHSGKDGSILAEWFGTDINDYFGIELARLPDLDGDAADELAVLSPFTESAGTDSGSIYIYAGRSGALLFRIDNPGGGTLGSIGSAGDVDGDGLADLYATQPAFNNEDGAVRLYSGADGHEICSFIGSGGERFGTSVCLVDDYDADGVEDLLVGATKYSVNSVRFGAVHIVSSVTGAILRTTKGTYNSSNFGSDVATLSDANGDGVREYAVAANDQFITSAGVHIRSGATGIELAWIIKPSETTWINPFICAAGDVNGDGFEDLAISGLWLDQYDAWGAAYLVSGKSFKYLDRIELEKRGAQLAPFGDLDGDGFDDLIFGTVDQSNMNGRVRVYGGNDLWLSGTPSNPETGDAFELVTREGEPGALTVVVLENVDGVPTFQLIAGIGTFDSLGGRELQGTVPAGLAGHEFKFRAYANDAAGRLISSGRDTISFQ